MRTPKLKRIDLSKTRGCQHPDIRENIHYLAKVKSAVTDWHAGTFTKQHYGWNFNAVYMAGYQLSYGGIIELYEIVEDI